MTVPLDEVERLRAAAAENTRRDEALADYSDAYAVLEMERDKMRPVVAAAVAWAKRGGRPFWDEAVKRDRTELIAAVAAYVQTTEGKP